MTARTTRRTFLRTASTVPLVVGMPALLAACATVGRGDTSEALRRLLLISSQRAVARLASPDAFLDDPALRVVVPQLDGRSGAVLGALLRSRPVQEQLLMVVNRAAARAANGAAPLVYDAIRNLTFGDALGIVRGGPTAATDYLESAIGPAIVPAMLPEVGDALRMTDEDSVLGPVLGAATGVNVSRIARSVTEAAAHGLWRAIGREEAAIRADPRRARDGLVEALLTGGRQLG